MPVRRPVEEIEELVAVGDIEEHPAVAISGSR